MIVLILFSSSHDSGKLMSTHFLSQTIQAWPHVRRSPLEILLPKNIHTLEGEFTFNQLECGRRTNAVVDVNLDCSREETAKRIQARVMESNSWLQKL